MNAVDTTVMNPQIQALARAIMQMASGYLVAHNIASADQSQALIGGLVALAAVLWSMADKSQAKQNVLTALLTPVPAATPLSPAAKTEDQP